METMTVGAATVAAGKRLAADVDESLLEELSEEESESEDPLEMDEVCVWEGGGGKRKRDDEFG
jgi:hypothetical protein